MKRIHVHLAFGAAAAVLGLSAAGLGWRLQQADRIAWIVAHTSVSDPQRPEPAAEFARAQALSAAGQYEAAAQLYQTLSASDRADWRSSALFNLSNLHLREALRHGSEEAARSLPLIELAKQGYRDLLRVDPQDWDARYNLERALWLAPEVDESSVDGGRVAGPRERAITTMQGFRRDLP